MPKKRRYGGLSPRHVRLIRDHLRDISATRDQLCWVWINLVIDAKRLDDALPAKPIKKSTFNALKAGLKVLVRKRIGRIWDWNPHQSFAALGITESPSRPSTNAQSTSEKQG